VLHHSATADSDAGQSLLWAIVPDYTLDYTI
jgi:hypothetical protein